MNDNKVRGYEAPIVEVIQVEIEQGFAVSDINGWGNGGSYEDSFII